MNISEAAERSGVSAKMIRHYESVALLKPAARRDNGYRDYGDAGVSVLRFIRRTRDLGLSLEEVGALLTLWRDRKRPSREVKRLAEAHSGDIERRMKEMRVALRALRDLAQHCRGDERSDWPILDDLATPPGARRRKHQ